MDTNDFDFLLLDDAELDADERGALERKLSQDPQARARLSELRQIQHSLRSLEAPAPSEAFVRGVLGELRKGVRGEHSRQSGVDFFSSLADLFRPREWGFASACLLLLLTFFSPILTSSTPELMSTELLLLAEVDDELLFGALVASEEAAFDAAPAPWESIRTE